MTHPEEVFEVRSSDPLKRPCTFCHAASNTRHFLFVNEFRDCIICDRCVMVMSVKLNNVLKLEQMPETVTRQ